MKRILLKGFLFFILLLLSQFSSAQFVTTTDNENSSFSGDADGDIDEWTYVSSTDFVEFSITTSGTPEKSVYLAINAYDVNVVNSYDVYLNGDYIGKLRGKGSKWVITFLEVPVSSWVTGKNEVIIKGYSKTRIKVDWGQLIVDGGSKDGAELNSFRLDKFDSYLDGFFEIKKWRIYNDLDIAVSSGSFSVQHQLVEKGVSGNDQIEDIGYCSTSSSLFKTMTFSYRDDNASKYYYCRAFLVNDATDEIVDFDVFKFHHSFEVGPDPFLLKFSNSTDLPTTGNVTITCSEFNNYNSLSVKHILLPDGTTTTNMAFSYTATSNGTYDFTVVLTDGTTYSFEQSISNIDRTKPVISLIGTSSVEIYEESTYLDAGVNATDNYNGEITSDVVTYNPVNTNVPGTYTVNYNVSDQAGNVATQVERTVIVKNKTLEVNCTSPIQSTTSVQLVGNILYLGESVITNHGFVWGFLPNPSLEINQGYNDLNSITEKGQFVMTSSSFEMGASYYVRSYATNSDGTVYSKGISFTYNGMNYGTLSIEKTSYTLNEGGSTTINVTRTGGSEGSITVDYSTLNGNALAGSDYTLKNGTLTFGEGVTSKSITLATQSNSNYTGDKQFYLELDNISNGAINRDISSIFISDLQTKPTYSLVKHTLLSGTTSYPYNKYHKYYDLDVSDYSDLISGGELYATMHGEKYSEKETWTTDDLSRLVFYHSDTQVAYLSNAKNSWKSLNDARTVISGSTYIRIETYGVAQGGGGDDANVKFRNLYITLKDQTAPTISSISSNTGTYIFNDKIYIAVSISERVVASGAKLTLSTGNTSSGTASLVSGSETNCLLFEYSVREGDNISALSVTAISGVEDYQPNTLNSAYLPKSLSGVVLDGVLPTISLVDQGSISEWQNTHTYKVNLANSDDQQYAWSISTTMPVAGWTAFSSGDLIGMNTGDGAWYLHVYASRDNGNSKYVVSSDVNLDNTDPVLSLSANTTDWCNTSVVITATQTEDHPSVLSNPVGSNSATYTAWSSGEYSFTATDQAGNSRSKSILIENIETVDPEIVLSPDGSGSEWVSKASTIVSVSDASSGITSFSYCWNSSAATPSSGWGTNTGITNYLSDETAGSRYLHIKATDVAGNIAYLNSSVFYVDNILPQLDLTYTNPTSWINADVSVVVSASKTTGQTLTKVILPDQSELAAVAGIAAGSYTISENGLYWFQAVDAAGNVTEKSILVTKIDKEVPVLEYSLSTSSWTNADVTLNISLDDQNTTIYDGDGYITGYSSSGELKIKEGTGDFETYSSEIAETITENTTLEYVGKDALGNTVTQSIVISNIDKNAPTVTSDNENYEWQTSDFTVALTFDDAEEGWVMTKEYALTSSAETPDSYTNYSSDISFSTEGTFYLHYHAIDGAGNIATGYFGPYQLDKTGPVVTMYCDTYTYYDPWIYGGGYDNVSGMDEAEKYQFAIDGVYGEWTSSNRYIASDLMGNKAYQFKVRLKNNAGLMTESAVQTKYTRALPPTAILTANSATVLTFEITPNPDNDVLAQCKYEIRDSESGDVVDEITYTYETTITFTGLTPGTSYRLVANPVNEDGIKRYYHTIFWSAITNRSPVAEDESYTLYMNHVLTQTGTGVLANDTDADGNTLTAEVQDNPTTDQGALVLNSDGSFTFTPVAGFTGTASFTYKANDGYVDSDNTATVSINVVQPIWNGTGVHTITSNWNGNELPIATDEVIIQSGTMAINSNITFKKLYMNSTNAAHVLVGSGATLTISNTVDYSGDALQAENGGIILIGGDLYEDDTQKVKITKGLRVKSGISIP